MKLIDILENTEEPGVDTSHHPLMTNPERAYNYVRDVIGGRWPEAEPYIMKDPMWAYKYARDVIGGRWPEAEPYIMKYIAWAYVYAKNVINMGETDKNTMIRWPEAEPIIMTDPEFAYKYAKEVIKGRWPEAEPIIMTDPEFAYKYAKEVIVPSLKLDQSKSPDQIRELLTDELLIKMNKLVYDDIVKKFFPRSSLLVDRWVGYGDHVRQRKPRGTK